VDLLDSFLEVADVGAALGSHVAALPDAADTPPSAPVRQRGQKLLLAFLEEQIDGTKHAVDRARDNLQVCFTAADVHMSFI
jgi:hypothetical protein